MGAVLTSLLLSLRQLGDPAVLRILGKSLAITLGLFALLGWAGWWALDGVLGWLGLAEDGAGGWAAELRAVAALMLVVLAGWLLWRMVALAVIQFFADEVVLAVEQRHYPASLGTRRELGWREELGASLQGLRRALLANLLALPFALALLVTGFGTALLFWLVNAVVLGRELQDMVWLRHRQGGQQACPATATERFLLGGAVTFLLMLPIANFVAPVLGAAAATHLVHRKKVC